MPLRVITRKEWGARYPDGFADRPMPFTEFWLHHSVTVAPDLVPPFDDDDAAVRTLERIGQQRFGRGISYNQPVTPAGRVYVGVSPHREGAHTYRHNRTGFAFVLVGDYSTRPPTALQREVIARRMVELHRAGQATRHTLNGGHRDSSGTDRYPTSCPGDAAHAAIPGINARANQLWALNYPARDIPLGDDMYTDADRRRDDTTAGFVSDTLNFLRYRLQGVLAAAIDPEDLAARIAAQVPAESAQVTPEAVAEGIRQYLAGAAVPGTGQ